MPTPLWVAFIGDGYVYGASRNGQAANPWYWGHEARYDPGFAIVYYHRVPAQLAADLCNQGTSEQTFGDGYLAAFALAKVETEQVVCHENDPSEYAHCPDCGQTFDVETWEWYGGCPDCGPSEPDADSEEDNAPQWDDTLYFCTVCDRPLQSPGYCALCTADEAGDYE